MRKTDFAMRERVAEELYKLGSDHIEIAHRGKFVPTQVKAWLDGDATPSATSLARFYNLGLDIVYILNGGDTRCSTHP